MVAIARIYVGLHLPIDVIGGLALGWVVGSIVSLAVGVPARGPDDEQLAHIVGELGVEPVRIDSISRSGDRHLCVAADGQAILVKTIDRNRPDQDWLYRIWRLVAFREISDVRSPTSPSQSVDRGYTAMMASAADVRRRR